MQNCSQRTATLKLNLIDACIVLIVSRLPSPTSSLAFAASTGRGAGNVRCVGAELTTKCFHSDYIFQQCQQTQRQADRLTAREAELELELVLVLFVPLVLGQVHGIGVSVGVALFVFHLGN